MQNKKYLLPIGIFIIIGTISFIFFWYFTKASGSNTEATKTLIINSSKPLPTDKQLTQDRYDKAPMVGTGGATPRNLETTVPEIPYAPFPTSLISDDCDTEHVMREAVTTNCWKGKLGGNNVTIFAGAQSHKNQDIPDNTDSKQGFVEIRTYNETTEEVSMKRVLTPQKVGSIKIT